MTTWVFCIGCSSNVTSGDFDSGAIWWNATTATSNPLDPASGPRFVPSFTPGDQVYWATQVDANGASNSLVSDLRAAIGRKQGGATISSPFQQSGKSLQNAAGPISPLSLSNGTNPPNGPWVSIGPFTVVTDSGNAGKKSRYAFVLTAALSNQAQFGEDPQMDVDNNT